MLGIVHSVWLCYYYLQTVKMNSENVLMQEGTMHKNRVMILMIALSMALSQLAGCGEKKPEELPVVQEKAEEPDATSEGADVKTAETATTEETDREEPAGEEPVEEVSVVEEWQKILLDIRTLYEALYALPTIMET